MLAVVALIVVLGVVLGIRHCRHANGTVENSNAPTLEQVQADYEVLAKQLRECEAREDARK